MRIPISEHHKDQLLSTLMHYLPQDQRRILMLQVPEAYNAYCKANNPNGPVQVVRVHLFADGSVVE